MLTRSPAGRRTAIVSFLALQIAACMSRSGFEGQPVVPDVDPCLAEEACDNGVDDDCDGLLDEGCISGCGAITSFRDDFDDATPGSGWEVRTTGATATEADGVLTLRPTAANGSATYYSSDVLAVAGGVVALQVVEMVDTASSARFMLTLVRNGAGYLNLRQTQGSLIVEQGTFAGDYTALASLPYDPEAHRWWRFVFDTAQGAAEVSPDGVTWTQLAVFSLTFPSDVVHVGLVAEAADALSPGQARVADFNGAGSGALSNCPIDALADDFDDGVIGPLWDRSFTSGGAILVESAGDIVLTPAAGLTGGAGLFSSNRYDLRGRSITARVTQVLAPSTSTDSVLRVISGPSEAFFLVRNNRLIALVAQNGSNVLADVAYSAAQHRCWRFRESGGTLFWETAGGTCTTFATLASIPAGFDLGSVAVIIFAQALAGVPTPGSMHVDSLTIP